MVGYGSRSKEIYYIFSYDLAKVLITGMEFCQMINKEPDDPECLKEELKKINITGKSGNVKMTSSGTADLSPDLYTVKDKELIIYDE